MRLIKYKNELHRRLQDSEYAAAYLAEILLLKDERAFLIALRDIVEASGGVGALAQHVKIKRPSLYKILSREGNPRLKTLQQILKPLGLTVTIKKTKEAA